MHFKKKEKETSLEEKGGDQEETINAGKSRIQRQNRKVA